MAEENQTTAEKKTEVRKGVSFPGILLRLVLAAVIGLIIGAVIYFGSAGWIPYLEQRIFQPLDKNKADINLLLETQQAAELLISQHQEQIHNLQATMVSLENDLNNRFEDNSALREAVDVNTDFVLQGTQTIATLDASINSINRNLSALATAQMRRSFLQSDLSLLKVVDLLTLADQQLLHANYGQAQHQLTLAGIELGLLQDISPPHYQSHILAIKDLVLGASADLPEEFTLSSDKIQLARQLALQGFPGLTGTITATPYHTPSRTPTPGQ